jgi:riboflavin transporter FmnP
MFNTKKVKKVSRFSALSIIISILILGLVMSFTFMNGNIIGSVATIS